jgi:Uma2 family endonuclease
MAPLSGMGGDYFNGAPEVIVEVLSPSNTAREIAEKARISLANGTREFWVLDGKRRQVEVTTKDGRVTVYQSGEEIPLYFAPGKSIAVDAIFG